MSKTEGLGQHITDPREPFGGLLEGLSAELAQAISAHDFGYHIIALELAKRGIEPTEKQRASILRQLTGRSANDSIRIRLSSGQRERLRDSGQDSASLGIDLGALLDSPEAESLLEDATKAAGLDIISRQADELLGAWSSQARSLLRRERRQSRKHVTETWGTWGEALEILEALRSVCLQVGSEFNDKHRPNTIERQDFLFEALSRCHARACQIVFEILILLKNGLADGAYARWRSLHELTVVAMFLAERGNEVAERYLLHQLVCDQKDAAQYQRYCTRIGMSRMPADNLESFEKACGELVERFGREFTKDYGWAAASLESRGVSFVDIEEAVNLDHMRPFYRRANLNVHAHSKGIFRREGASPSSDGRELLIAGPSVYGLDEPGRNTALSIGQITAKLLLSKPTLWGLSLVSAILQLGAEAFWAFVRAAGRQEGKDQVESPQTGI